MSFEQFAESHGLIIDNIISDRWVRVPTRDKPTKRNGSYIWDGHSGAVQNWAIHEKPIVYKSEGRDPFYRAKRVTSDNNIQESRKKAVSKANFMFKNSEKLSHPYLEKKGFKSKYFVWNSLLLIPMKFENTLVGCQMIDMDGNKKFLRGQLTKGVSLKLGNTGRDILVEGFATGLSVYKVAKGHTIHICFSANNMLEIAKDLKNPLVIADHDPIGIRTAKKIGQYWLSDRENEDFNDAHQRGYIGNIIELLG